MLPFKRFNNTRRFLYTSVHNATRCNFYPHLELKDEVPRLPVPSLQHTLNQYQTILKPILTKEQFEKAQKCIQEFAETDAPSLQEELLRLDREAPTSYIEGFWDTMYLELRCPNPINVNPVYQMNVVREATQEKTASKILSASAHYAMDIHEGTIEKDTVGKNKQPLCMSQFRNFFGTARVPRNERDELWKYIGSRHAIILSDNQFYKLEIMDANNVPYSPAVLEEALLRIRADSKSSPASRCFGVLTSEDRNVWAGQRSLFENFSPKNADFLKVVDSALLVLVLDNRVIESKKDVQEMLLTGSERWFDKLQVIVSKNSYAGANMEHAPYDGATLLNYGYYVVNLPTDKKYSPANSVTFNRMNYDEAPVIHGISKAYIALDALNSITDHAVCEFKGYGKKGIVGMGFGPDSFVQMAFQLAYYDIEGKTGSTYESAMTKRFYHGRTETLRSVSEESVHFTKIFRDLSTSREDKIAALKAATAAHTERMKLAQQGLGVDRHLYALHNLAKLRQQRLSGYDIPKLFLDESYGIMKTDMLSTSNCSNPAIGLFAFGATSNHGYGLGYVINDNDVVVGITNYEKKSNQYKEALEKAFHDMQSVVQSV